MKKKLAITISGAVSLGSYEAGVLYEVIRALGQHNQNPATPPADKIYIDVLTGASAGGMTATIAANKLLYEAQSLAGATTNAFYQPWVAEIGIQRLLNLHGADSADKSIFSSEAVTEISRKYITGRYQSHLSPPPDPHPALDADNLKLGLAMSNLNGVDYSAPLRPAGQLTYTQFKDELIKEFDVPNAGADDDADVWEALRSAAVSCGAFPFAFKVVEVTRHLSEYTLPERATSIGNTTRFAYTDGGVFQNEPLSLAKRLVDSIDGHQNLENRFFLFVAPDLRKSSANADFNDQNANFISTAAHLVGAIFGQSRFPDLLMAEELNCEVMLLNSRAEQMRTLLNANDPATLDKAKTLRAAADLLLPALFAGAPASALEDARARLRNQFAADYNGMEPQTRDTWIDSILALERAAGLAETDEMTIYSIIANDAELASADLEAFAGFFDRSYREHDYLVGRRKAQAFLATPGIFGLNGPLNFQPEPVPVPDPDLDGLKLADMDAGVREAVRDAFVDRANAIMTQAGVDWVIAGPIVREIVDIFVKRKLDELLQL
jgi:predicted acylesterase/phospholipase RssA